MQYVIGNEYVNSAYIGYFVFLGDLNYVDLEYDGMTKIPSFLHYPQDETMAPMVIRWSGLYERESYGFRPRIKVSG